MGIDPRFGPPCRVIMVGHALRTIWRYGAPCAPYGMGNQNDDQASFSSVSLSLRPAFE